VTVAKINAPLLQIQCPPLMRNLQGWLVWRLEQHEGEEKARKVPYYAGGGRRTGQQGTDDDRSKLVTFDAAIAVAYKKNYTGVGFAPMPDFNVTALDFDHVVGTEHQAAIEEMLAGTYAEFSPSGAGIRAFVRGAMPNRKSHAGDKWPFTFETFGSKGFVTFTGMALAQNELLGGDVGHASDGVKALVAERFMAPTAIEGRSHTEEVVGLSDEQLRQLLAAISAEDYQTWIDVGMALHHETRGEGFELYDEWSQTASNYVGREGVGKKWESFGKRSEGRSLTGRLLIKLGGQGGVSVGGPVASADDFEIIEGDEGGQMGDKSPGNLSPRFEIIPAAAFARRPPPRWIVDHVIPEADLVTLYGESGAGKSFVALDLTMAIARGVEWRGKAVRQGRVVYIAAEGGGGFRNRLVAYAHHHQVELGEVPFGIIHATPNLLAKDDVKDLQAVLKASEGADVIVIDTFAQVTAGANENAGEDMGLALRNARRLGEASGAVVILVHHSGKDASKGARGWSGIRAASDAELEVVRTDAGRWIRTTKQKDGEDDAEWGFELGKVTIGEDDQGREIESCVVLEKAVPADKTRNGKRDRPRGGKGANRELTQDERWEAAVEEALAELTIAEELVSLPDLVARTVALRPEIESHDRAKNSLARKAVFRLKADGVLDVENNHVFTLR
jgi:hypothetical protein